ncbi:ribonuclease HI [Chitinophaga sp. SYP-B3965]|uniref:ribonuclease H family protein n=1 Tax=Chitinophaga sp. SYP-B3965 TaxID=2663120 RepID=UPI001299AD98|nr:ribonuclease H [Chitinophaga sp. SYP-B3965]MRG43493.1 ribonuclease HI [Chitinophaga sp. SYP-B3965]
MDIYTDGSCNTQNLLGAWGAVILTPSSEKIVLSGKEVNTTHQRMELLAVIKALRFVGTGSVTVYSDSQYVTGLVGRKLGAKGFMTKKGAAIRNADLVREFLALEAAMEVTFVKVKAHGEGVPFNVEVDRLVRGLVRERV